MSPQAESRFNDCKEHCCWSVAESRRRRDGGRQVLDLGAIKDAGSVVRRGGFTRPPRAELPTLSPTAHFV